MTTKHYIAIGIGVILFVGAVIGGTLAGIAVISPQAATVPKTVAEQKEVENHSAEKSAHEQSSKTQPPQQTVSESIPEQKQTQQTSPQPVQRPTITNNVAPSKLTQAEKEAKIQELSSDMQVKTDDMRDITFYPPKLDLKQPTIMNPYIGVKHPNETCVLRLEVCYTGDDWIFFDTVYIKTPTRTHILKYKPYTGDHDVSSGSVFETFDQAVDSDTLAALRDIAATGSAKIRLSGKYFSERNLSDDEVQRIKNILDLYDVLRVQ